jgi:hypothetical protein
MSYEKAGRRIEEERGSGFVLAKGHVVDSESNIDIR